MHAQTGRGIGMSLMRTHQLEGGDVDGLITAARISDSAGVSEVHVSDHVAISQSARAARTGFPYPIDFPWFEPLELLAAVAVTTKHVRLATNVLVAPARPAVLLAKQLATLDALSHGRVSIAFGVGWQREEFDALGISFDDRLPALDVAIDVCRLLWSTAPAQYEGPGFSFEDLWSLPFPPQGGALPISVGLPLSESNIQRIVNSADGWFPPPLTAELLGKDLDRLAAACEAAGRDPASLKITAPLSLAADGLTFDEAGFLDPLEEAESLFRAGADVVVAHPLPYCRNFGELEEFATSLVNLTQ